MKIPRTLLVLTALGALAGGCTQDFTERPLSPAPLSARQANDSPRTWSPETCRAVLEKPSGTPDRPASSRLSDREARRLATVRLVELYGPALLASPQHTVQVPSAPGRSWTLSLRRGAGPGGVEPSLFTSLVPVDDFALKNVPVYSRTPGEGAPLVGALRPILPVGQPDLEAPQQVSGITWPVTAVPGLGSATRVGSRADGGSGQGAVLDLYDPRTTGRTVHADGGTSRLAADYATPLAVSLTHFRPERRGLMGFLRGGKYLASSGLFPMEPPNPAKTPLVLVHGLISDPTDFSYLLNAFNGNAGMRRRYQVWFFYYPSSLPVPYSAMLLREDLASFIRQLDPAGTHPALHRAVLVGHSMGGVLCRLAVSDGGDRYYGHFFRRPLDDLRLTPDQRALVRRSFYYRANPDTAQVVFIATPHGGSRLASGLLGNLGRLLVRVPVAVRTRIHGIISQNRDALADGTPLKPASSLDSLSPHDPLIAALRDMPFRPGVRLHSVLGNRGRSGPVQKSSDGVVPYASAHLPQARSEVIVPAGHTGTLRRPETVAELLRILL